MTPPTRPTTLILAAWITSLVPFIGDRTTRKPLGQELVLDALFWNEQTEREDLQMQVKA